jgi:hypothetical protein
MWRLQDRRTYQHEEGHSVYSKSILQIQDTFASNKTKQETISNHITGWTNGVCKYILIEKTSLEIL